MDREMLTFTSTWSDEPTWAEEEQYTLAEKLVFTKFRREDFPLREICMGKFMWFSQTHGVTEVLCRSTIDGETGTNTQPITMVTNEVTTYEEETVGMSD